MNIVLLKCYMLSADYGNFGGCIKIPMHCVRNIKQINQYNRWIKTRKINKASHCKHCVLRFKKYCGPVFFKPASNTKPKIMIISESPAGLQKINFNCHQLRKWYEQILQEMAQTKINHYGKWPNTLGEFLPYLTNGRIVTKTKQIHIAARYYWTHAVRCFIQTKKQKKIRSKNKNVLIKNALRTCRNYLLHEIKLVKPKIIVILGETAYRALLPSFEDAVIRKVNTEKLRLPHLNSTKLFTLYHPGAQIEKKEKTYGYQFVRRKI